MFQVPYLRVGQLSQIIFTFSEVPSGIAFWWPTAGICSLTTYIGFLPFSLFHFAAISSVLLPINCMPSNNYQLLLESSLKLWDFTYWFGQDCTMQFVAQTWKCCVIHSSWIYMFVTSLSHAYSPSLQQILTSKDPYGVKLFLFSFPLEECQRGMHIILKLIK